MTCMLIQKVHSGVTNFTSSIYVEYLILGDISGQFIAAGPNQMQEWLLCQLLSMGVLLSSTHQQSLHNYVYSSSPP